MQSFEDVDNNESAIPNSLRGYAAKVVPVVKPLSVSAITDYLYCPGCAYRRFVLHHPFEETIHSLRGQMSHVAYEWFLSKEVKFVELVRHYSKENVAAKLNEDLKILEFVLKRRFDDRCTKLGIKCENEISGVRSTIEEKLRKWLISLSEANCVTHESNIPNRQFEIFIKSDSLGIAGGRIDVIENGSPVEIKTGYAPAKRLMRGHVLQLVWYALLLEYKNGINVNSGEVYYTKIEERRAVNIDAKLRLWAFEVRAHAAESLQASVIPDCTCGRSNELKPDMSTVMT